MSDEKDTSLEEATAEAQSLRELAQKTRLEAEKLSVNLTLEKIQSLEMQLENPMNNLDEANVRDQIEMLKRQLRQSSNVDKTPSSDSSFNKKTPMTNQYQNVLTSDNMGMAPVEQKYIQSTATIDRERNSMIIPPIPSEELETRVKAFNSFPPDLKKRFAETVNIYDVTDAEGIMNSIYLAQQRNMRLRQQGLIDESEMTPVDWITAEAGYWKLPPPIKFMIAQSVGLDGSNDLAVIEKLVEDKKVQPGADGVEFFLSDEDQNGDTSISLDGEMGKNAANITADQISEGAEFFENLPLQMQTMLALSVDAADLVGNNSTAIVEKLMVEDKFTIGEDGQIAMELVLFDDDEGDLSPESRYIKSLFPQVTRKFGSKPSKEDIDVIFTKVLGRKNFNPISKPESIVGGYLIRGENKMKSSDELIQQINEELRQKTDIADRIQVYYIKDPNPVTEEQVEYDEVEVPVLMITGADISPDTIPLFKQVISVTSVLCVAGYAVGSAPLDGSNVDLSVFNGAIAPLFLAMFIPQVAHEVAHQVVAFKDKFKAGVPTLVPSILTGITGCITPLKTPPKNLNSLFDFAISGPIVGMITSLLMMYVGLESQVFMDQIDQSTLPTLPLILVKSSSLGSGMVEWLLGNGALLSPDPMALIRLHPLAIAGLFGIITNALSLLPLGNTDGGRIATSLFGRSFATLLHTLTLFVLGAIGLFGGDESNILLFYAMFILFFQREPEIPCQNEVDGIDDFRALFAFGTAVLVGLSLVPMTG